MGCLFGKPQTSGEGKPGPVAKLPSERQPSQPINGPSAEPARDPGGGPSKGEEAANGELLLLGQKATEPPSCADTSAPPSRSQSGSSQPLQLKFFRFKELARATSNFKEPDMVLGEGGFGKVYKGWVRDPSAGPDSIPVAVKRLNPDSFQGQQEWQAEILVLSRLQHPNLVRLVGFCADDGEGMLVYEFMSRGSLDYHIFPDADEEGSPPVLAWDIRLKVALEAATGLAYLHENYVIHRDFKAPNILLDDNWNAKLTDFGLAKGSDQSVIITRIMGTMGYLDPKYMETGQLTKKSDVYAFGVLLLELLTGRRAADPTTPNAPGLTAWAQRLLDTRRPDIFALADPRLHDQLESKAAQKTALRLAVAAKHCIDRDPNLRPTMADMVETLRPLVLAADSRASSLREEV